MRYIPPEKRPDLIKVTIPKGKRKVYKQVAKELGLSLSMLVQHGVEEYMSNHADEESICKLKAEEKLSKKKQRLLEAFDALPKESRTIILKLVEDFAEKALAVKNI